MGLMRGSGCLSALVHIIVILRFPILLCGRRSIDMLVIQQRCHGCCQMIACAVVDVPLLLLFFSQRGKIVIITSMRRLSRQLVALTPGPTHALTHSRTHASTPGRKCLPA